MSDSPNPPPTELPPSTPPPASTAPPGSPAPNSGSGHSWEVACHLAGFSGYLTGVGWILGPLIVWLLKRTENPAVEEHGKEALNFQISILIYGVILALLGFVTCGVGFFLLIPLSIAHVVLMILAAIKAGNGESYRYPCTLRLVT